MTFDPTRGVRLAPPWAALGRLLADGAWHHRRDCIDAMLASSDLAASTCSNLIRSGVDARLLEQHGAWHGRGDDRRHIRIPQEDQ